MAIIGNDSDNRLRGTTGNDSIQGRAGNDTLEGLGGIDTLLGGKDDDNLFGGAGNDVLSGDGNSVTISTNGSVSIDRLAEKGNDVIVGGAGTDTIIGWGDDVLVGGGPASFSGNTFVDNLKSEPFTTPITRDRQRDTFVALNKDGIDYTLTVADYEVGIDRIDLRAFGVRRASDFVEIQDKGNFFEVKTPEVNSGELLLRINVAPTTLTFVV